MADNVRYHGGSGVNQTVETAVSTDSLVDQSDLTTAVANHAAVVNTHGVTKRVEGDVQMSPASVLRGTNFTVATPQTGVSQITFNPAFSSAALNVKITPLGFTGGGYAVTARSTTQVEVRFYNSAGSGVNTNYIFEVTEYA